MRAVCLGDVVVDNYYLQGKRMLGGISGNVALGLREQGVASALVSAVGSDRIGAEVLRALNAAGVDTSQVPVMPGETAEQRIHLGSDGERRFEGYRAGVLDGWRLDARELEKMADAALIHIPLADRLENLFDQTCAWLGGGSDRPRSAVDFSVNYEFATRLPELIPRYAGHFDCIFLGADDFYRGLFAELSVRWPEKKFVLTMGAAGVLLFEGGREVFEPAPTIPSIVDTTGCGDAFQAGFLAAELAGKSAQLCLAEGSRSAARCARRLGATAYGLDDIEKKQ